MSDIGQITKNAAQCLKCGDVIESKHRHDYVSCRCGAIAVDGGLEYAKRTGHPRDISELSEWGPASPATRAEEPGDGR